MRPHLVGGLDDVVVVSVGHGSGRMGDRIIIDIEVSYPCGRAAQRLEYARVAAVGAPAAAR
jgi:hypothetical protein